jgi:hypothetical protein
MVSAGIALVVFDSRVIQRSIRKVKNLFRGMTPAQNVELGENTTEEDTSPQTGAPSAQENTIPVDSTHDIASSLRNRQARSEENVNLESSPQNPAARVRAEDVIIPYSIRTGLVLFALFVISFIVTMVVRGTVSDAPLLFQFYANMYLAGSSSYIVSSNGRNHYIRYHHLCMSGG